MSSPSTRTGVTGMQGLQPAVRAVVLDALHKGVGGTLQRSSDLQASVGVGAGTIQRAITLLAEQGAVTTQARGHLGRTITAIDIGAAWHLAQLGPVRIVLSPSGAIEIDALHSTISSELSEMDVPHSLEAMSGGEQRLRALLDGDFDITAVSAGTFETFIERNGDSQILASTALDPGTYYRRNRLVTVSRAHDTGTPRRIAIDPDSYDHRSLTLAEFPESGGFDYVEITYSLVPAYVLAGYVDAGVWRMTKSPVPVSLAGLRATELQRPEAVNVLRDFSRTVIVARSDRPELRAVLNSLTLTALVDNQDRADAEDAALEQRILATADTLH